MLFRSLRAASKKSQCSRNSRPKTLSRVFCFLDELFEFLSPTLPMSKRYFLTCGRRDALRSLFFSAISDGVEKTTVLKTRQTKNAIARFWLPQRTLRVLQSLLCSTPKRYFWRSGRRDALRLLLFRPPRAASKKLRCSRNSSPQMLSRICGCFMRTLRVLSSVFCAIKN